MIIFNYTHFLKITIKLIQMTEYPRMKLGLMIYLVSSQYYLYFQCMREGCRSKGKLNYLGEVAKDIVIYRFT